MKKPIQLIVTRRGIIDIDEVTINDEVYTAKRRWRKVVSIETQSCNKFIKSTHSFLTPIGKKQSDIEINKIQVPYYVPRDKNLDNKPLEYWFKIGKLLSSLDSVLYQSSFFIPINVILMDKTKCKSFLDGFFSNNVDITKLDKRARLGLSFMLKKQTKGYEYRSTYIVSKKNFTSNNNCLTIKTLSIDEDDSYCINGLYVFNLK